MKYKVSKQFIDKIKSLAKYHLAPSLIRIKGVVPLFFSLITCCLFQMTLSLKRISIFLAKEKRRERRMSGPGSRT
jgi:hypothetical protein